MNYRSQTKNRTAKNAMIVFFLVILVFGGFYVMQTKVFSTFAKTVDTSVVLKQTVKALFGDKKNLLEENIFLRNKIANMDAALALSVSNRQAYVDLWNENKGLSGQSILGEVLLRPPYSAYDQYIIDVGLNDGVQERQLVLTAGEYVLGYVDQSSEQYSRVQLFSSPKASFMVSIDGVLYPAEGNGGGTVLIRLPRAFVDTEKKIVKLPGAGPYIMGYLQITSFDPQDSFVLGIMKTPVNIFQQELVTVVEQQYFDTDEIIRQDNE